MNLRGLKSKSILFIFFILWPSIGFGIDLAQLARMALNNSDEIRWLKEKIQSAEIASKKQWGRFTPTVSLSASHTRTDQEKPVDIARKDSIFSLSLSQPLYQPDLNSDYQESTLKIEAAANQLQQAQDAVTVEVMTIVLDICQLNSRYVLTANSLSHVSKTVGIQEQLLKSGYGSRIDLTEAIVEKARYQKDLKQLETELQLRLSTLSLLAGQDYQVSDFSPLSNAIAKSAAQMLPDKPEFWIAAAGINSGQLRRVRIDLQLNRINHDRSFNHLKPSVDLTFNYKQSEEEALVRSRVDESSVQLSMTIGFTPVSAYYRIHGNEISRQVLLTEEKKIRRDLTDRIQQLLRSIRLKQGNLESQRQWKSQQAAILELYRKGLKQKHFPFSRFLENSRKFNESQLDLIQTTFSIWEDRIRLLHISGLLTIEKLKEIQNRLTPVSEGDNSD